jgi:hypothetical protein
MSSTLATVADALALDLVENAERPERVLAVAAHLASLAHRLREREAEAEAAPAHLRLPPQPPPPGVVRLCGRRAR